MSNSTLILKNLSLGYDREIYREITANAHSGEMVALVGPNGIGKSTLLKSIASIQNYRSGEIRVDSHSIKNYSQKELSSMISFVPSQSPRAVNLSVFDMVSSGCFNRTNWLGEANDEDRILVMDTLNRVGLEGFATRDSSKLSDGEFQRAAIARALVQKSGIMLLDEPTAFLDIENKLVITRLLAKLTKEENRCIIFSTHDLQLAIKLCDKIWLMGHERFSEGSPQVLIENGAFDTMFKDSGLKFDKTLYTFI
ncbi:MAG: ABC transporter ATP-binding protein [Bacteroidales bacterium]|jgi:iron complex transport system ATP-binding protein|nr:ABC transporter ATP-binding protein [Bacteroidales bacterium]